VKRIILKKSAIINPGHSVGSKRRPYTILSDPPSSGRLSPLIAVVGITNNKKNNNFGGPYKLYTQ